MFGLPDVETRLDNMEHTMESISQSLVTVVELLNDLVELEKARDNRV